MGVRRMILVVGALALGTLSVQAQTPTVNLTWTGAADNSWQNSANWSPTGTPGTGGNTIVGFFGPGAANLNTVTATGAVNSLTIDSIIFGPDADSSVTIGRTNTTPIANQFDRLRLNSTLTANGDAPAGTGVYIDAGSAGAHTINHDIILASGVAVMGGTRQLWTNNSAQPLTINGFIVRGGNTTRELEFRGTGTFIVNAEIGFDTTGAAVGGNQTIIRADMDGGLLRLTNRNSTTRGFNIFGANGAAVRVEHNEALGTTANATDIIGGADNTQRLELANNIITAEPITVGGRNNAAITLSNFSGNNTLTGPLTLGNGGTEYNLHSESGLFTINGPINRANTSTPNPVTRNLNLGGPSNGVISGVISNNPSSGTPDPVAVVKNGTGTWTLTGANTYIGSTTVNAGTLKLAGTGSFATSPAVVVAQGATLDVTTGAGNLTGGANFDSTTGRFALASGQTLRGTGTVNGGVTALSGSTVAVGPVGGGAGVLTINASGSGVSFQSGSQLAVRVLGGNPGSNGSSTDNPTNPTTNTLLSVTAGTLTFDPNAIVLVDGTGANLTHFQTYSYLVGQTTPGSASGGLSSAQIQYFGFEGSNGSLTTDPSGAVYLTFTPVPEPLTALGLSAAGLGLLRAARRRWRAG